MENTAEKIIVFDSFDNVILANLAKLKLDAYGIPCFITNENTTNLYPILNGFFPAVRLCVFESDLERIKEIMEEES